MRWLVRVALLFLAVWLALRWLARALGGRPAAPARGGTMKRDPVCGTYVAPEVSFPEIRGGQTLYFCSEHCRQEYRAGQRGVEAGSG
jgi:YHS domain-containing protein